MKKITIAIDGPAASGKSTTAKHVAQKLGYLHIDTGAMYRAITLKVLDEKVDIDNKKAIEALTQGISVKLEIKDGAMNVFLDGKDVTTRIRTPVVSRSVSLISSYGGVREIMVREQQSIAKDGGVVLEGRDIGTVVLPHAELKVFMVASVEERARRRKRELALNGVDADELELMKEIELRDRTDSTRKASPMIKAKDAIELDTTKLSIDEQVDFIVTRARKIIDQEVCV